MTSSHLTISVYVLTRVTILVLSVAYICSGEMRIPYPCVDNPGIRCADLDRTNNICTAFPDSEETRNYCPKFCGLCDGQKSTPKTGVKPPTKTSSTSSVTSQPSVTSAPFSDRCEDNPASKCADLDATAKICTVYRDSQETRRNCPKFCKLCGVTGPGTEVQQGSAPSVTTTVSFNGNCEDDPLFKCAYVDHTAHICTTFRSDPQTIKYCPKYCGFCGGTTVKTTTPGAATTLIPIHNCMDNPQSKCADLDATANICTVYRDDPTTRRDCPKFCGLCGNRGTPSTVTKSAPVASTFAPITTCKDNPASKCADLDATANICTVFREDASTRQNCPKFCGLCGGASVSSTYATANTVTAISTCKDDPLIDCADLNKTAKICTDFRNNPETQKNCPRFCGICPEATTTSYVAQTSLTSTPPATTVTADLHYTMETISNSMYTSKRRPTTSEVTSPVPSLGVVPSSGSSVETPPSLASITTPSSVETPPSLASITTPSSVETPPSIASITTPSSVETPPSIASITTPLAHQQLSTTTTQKTMLPSTGFSEVATSPSLVILFKNNFNLTDVDNDGVLSFLEFETLWAKLDLNGDRRVTLLEYSASTHFSSYIARELFAYVDHDHNHALTLQEVPRLFMEYDTNNDGLIEEEEFIQEYLRIYNFVKESLN